MLHCLFLYSDGLRAQGHVNIRSQQTARFPLPLSQQIRLLIKKKNITSLVFKGFRHVMEKSFCHGMVRFLPSSARFTDPQKSPATAVFLGLSKSVPKRCQKQSKQLLSTYAPQRNRLGKILRKMLFNAVDRPLLWQGHPGKISLKLTVQKFLNQNSLSGPAPQLRVTFPDVHPREERKKTFLSSRESTGHLERPPTLTVY